MTEINRGEVMEEVKVIYSFFYHICFMKCYSSIYYSYPLIITEQEPANQNA